MPQAKAPTKAKTSSRKTGARQGLQKAKLYITASFNNTIATLTDMKGNVIFANSCGQSGFKGARKSTPFASTTTISHILTKAKTLGIRDLELYIKGPGPGRDSAIRSVRANSFHLSLIADITPIPHNGCRPKKQRRV